jgi:hypothetical protein
MTLGSYKNRCFGGTYHLRNQGGKNQLLFTANVVPSSLILSKVIMEAIRSSETWFLQEPHGVTSQMTADDSCSTQPDL